MKHMARFKEAISTTANNHNILASGTHIKGDLFADDDFRVDGIIEGNVQCKGKIITGSNSKIVGDIECANIEMLGEIKGNIFCLENVILRATSNMMGNIKTKTIEIEPGAKFTGSCSMNFQQGAGTEAVEE